MLRQYGVQGYFSGHRHTMEHNQESGANGPNDLSFFLIGAEVLLDWGSMKNHLLEIPPLVNNACLSGNPADHRAHCHFYWYTKTLQVVTVKLQLPQRESLLSTLSRMSIE